MVQEKVVAESALPQVALLEHSDVASLSVWAYWVEQGVVCSPRDSPMTLPSEGVRFQWRSWVLEEASGWVCPLWSWAPC